ncbi:MAG: hypothetical protein WCZ01_04100, partial [Candidatus Neomarinimicrobiota bacterium]
MYDQFVRDFYFPLTQHIKGEKIAQYLKILRYNEHLPLEKLLKIQMAKLHHILNVAYQNVPYYQAIFNQLGIKPEDISLPQDFAHL